MKSKPILLALAAIGVILLAGIFWLEMDARNNRIAEQQHREQAAHVESLRLAESVHIEALHSIVNAFDFQYRILHNPALWPLMSSNKMEETWSNYYASYKEANRQLAMTQVDTSLPLPSTKYIDDEVAAELVTRTH